MTPLAEQRAAMCLAGLSYVRLTRTLRQSTYIEYNASDVLRARSRVLRIAHALRVPCINGMYYLTPGTASRLPVRTSTHTVHRGKHSTNGLCIKVLVRKIRES